MLKTFVCHNNLLTSLDVSQNNLLEILNFSENQINTIDVTNNPNLIEFWQEMPFRLHDRVEYKKFKNDWLKRRLYP